MNNIEKRDLPFSNIFGNGSKIKPEYGGIVTYTPEISIHPKPNEPTKNNLDQQSEIKKIVLITSKGGE